MDQLNTLYQNIIASLKSGKRPQQLLDKSIIEEIKLALKNPDQVKAALCVLDHSQGPIPEVTELLIDLLKITEKKEILIFTLEVSHKHIITEHSRRGIKLPLNYLQAIQKLFATDDWELREWLLRTVEACASSAKFFRAEILQIKPNLLSVFNVHARYCVEIIQLLETRLK